MKCIFSIQLKDKSMFNYSEYRVSKGMSFFVKKIWTLDNLNERSIVMDKAALPNGCFNIAIIRGKGLDITHKEKLIQLKKGIYFCGQMTESLSIEIHPYSRATMIQLFPWTPVCFTDLDMANYTDGFCEATDILPGLSDDEDLANSDICRALILKWSPLLKESIAAKNLHLSISLIMKTSGDINIESVSKAMECSIRYLQKLFKKGLGLSPKKFANIIKLRNIVDGLAYGDNSGVNLTTVAVNHNFYDQAHFTNAFQNMIKTSPGQFDGKDYFLSYIK